MHDKPTGFEVALFQPLLFPRLMLGAPRGVSIVMMGLATIAFIWSWWSAFPPVAVVQGVAILGTRLDEDWFTIGFRLLFYKRHYEA